MKKAARLIIFYSFCFIFLFLFVTLFRFLGYWIDSIRLNSVDAGQAEFLISAAWMALPATLFFTILFILSYTVRRKIPALLSIFIIIILSGAFSLGLFLGIERFQTLNITFEIPNRLSSSLLSKNGLILSRQDMTVVLLSEGTGVTGVNGGNILGISDYPRVVSFPDRPLVYQEAALGPFTSPLPLPFENRTSWLIESILIDFNLVAREFHTRFSQGLFSFGVYGLSLIFFLASLRFIFDLCFWPLANLFLGALVFRFVLSLQIFLNTPEALDLLNTFLGNLVPDLLLAPMVFCALGSLALLYTFFAFIARHKRRRHG